MSYTLVPFGHETSYLVRKEHIFVTFSFINAFIDLKSSSVATCIKLELKTLASNPPTQKTHVRGPELLNVLEPCRAH